MKTAPAGCIVTKGGVPCQIYNASASAGTMRGGVLVPVMPGQSVYLFTQSRDAKRAVQRTERVIAGLKGSLLDDWIKLTPLLDGRPFDILPLCHVPEATPEKTEVTA